MAVISSANFKYSVEPILNDTFDGQYALYPKQYTEVFDSRTGIKRASHEEPVLYNFGFAPQKPQGDVITYDESGTAGNAKYVYVVYGLAYAITEELMEDGDHMNVLTIQTQALANSMRQTKELVHANVLNNAFNSAIVGYDGQPLLSTAHVNGIAGTQSNTLVNPTPLSQAGLEQLLINMRNAVDGRGLRIDLKPKKLVVPTALQFQAERLLKSVLQSGTTNNDINAVKSIFGLDYFVMTRLSSATNWFIKTDAERGLTTLNRREISTQSMGDFDTGNMRYRSTMRFACGWTDFLGLFGALGTA